MPRVAGIGSKCIMRLDKGRRGIFKPRAIRITNRKFNEHG